MTASPWRTSAVAILAALAAGLLLYVSFPAQAAPPCFTHQMQLDQLPGTETEFGPWLNKRVNREGVPGSFLSITVRGKQPDIAYIASFNEECFSGHFITVPSREVKHLFTPAEWGSLTAQEM